MLQLYTANFLFGFLIRLKWRSNSFRLHQVLIQMRSSPNSTGPWPRHQKIGESLIIFINNKSRGENAFLEEFLGYRDIGKILKRIWDT